MIRQADASATARKWSNVRCVVTGPVAKSATLIRLVRPDGVKTVYDGSGSASLTLVASPSSVGGGSKSNIVTTVPVTVGVTGGTAPYTHSWALSTLSGAASATALSPTSPTTQFRGTGVAAEGAEGSFIDTVTDANGLSNQIEVPAFFSRF